MVRRMKVAFGGWSCDPELHQNVKSAIPDFAEIVLGEAAVVIMNGRDPEIADLVSVQLVLSGGKSTILVIGVLDSKENKKLFESGASRVLGPVEKESLSATLTSLWQDNHRRWGDDPAEWSEPDPEDEAGNATAIEDPRLQALGYM